MLYPVFLKLRGRRVLVVGAGPVAAQKLPALLAAEARVVVVAPRVSPEVRAFGVEVHERGFVGSDLDGVCWVVAAATPAVNRKVGEAAEARGLFVNAVDDAEAASAYLGGVVRRGQATVAVSTGGRAPALAGLLREALERVLPHDLGEWVELAAALRPRWRDRPHRERRGLLLRALNTLYGERAA